MAAGTVGKIVQVLGAVIDCEFPPDQMPAIFSALEVRRDRAAVTDGAAGGTGAGSGVNGGPAGDGEAAGKAGEAGEAQAGHLADRLVLEVEQHIGNNWVRCVAMDTTDGIRRGMDAVDTGAPITVPVGRSTLGRLFNVLGEPADERGPVTSDKQYPIHRPSPSFEEQATQVEMFETGIKVVDLIAPFTKGGKTGIFGGAG
jgi:F-type H+-transporting ATPase subunit beta